MIVKSFALKSPLPSHHLYQFVQEAVSREIRIDVSALLPIADSEGAPNANRARPVEIRQARGEAPSPLIEAALPRSLMLSREFVEADPEQAIARFFAHVGSLWEDFGSTSGNQALAGTGRDAQSHIVGSLDCRLRSRVTSRQLCLSCALGGQGRSDHGENCE